MATANQVREAIKAQPFRPFVVRLVDGRSYPVPHPDFAREIRCRFIILGNPVSVHHSCPKR